MSTRQRMFVLDLNRCVGCQACRVACQTQNQTPVGLNFRQVTSHMEGTFPDLTHHHLSVSCNHCHDPGCMKVCPTGAITKRDTDGVVLIAKDLCNGCGRCMPACPYGAPRRVPSEDKVAKCDFCSDRLAKNQSPACVETCIGDALHYCYEDEFEGRFGGRPLTACPEGFADPARTRPPTRFLAKKG